MHESFKTNSAKLTQICVYDHTTNAWYPVDSSNPVAVKLTSTEGIALEVTLQEIKAKTDLISIDDTTQNINVTEPLLRNIFNVQEKQLRVLLIIKEILLEAFDVDSDLVVDKRNDL